jgi:hypothetical protein
MLFGPHPHETNSILNGVLTSRGCDSSLTFMVFQMSHLGCVWFDGEKVKGNKILKINEEI